ncbi:MAG: alpha/beta fold hydrolase [Gammaproteobacteria bacterium]|nr:alpha/beta fold hydrolase [Gammaproteobacteria bacterium]
MRRLIKFISVFLFIVAAYQTHAVTKRHPTMILLHGALFTSDVWLPVQTHLQNDGYNVITVDTPGRLYDGVKPKDATLTAAVTKLCKVVDIQPEPVLLVGHNQAGAIITQAIAHCGKNIKGLVYLAAVVPWPGEQPFDVLNDQDNCNFDLAAPLDNKSGLSIPGSFSMIKSLFMPDADDNQAKNAVRNMVAEPIIFAYEALQYDMTAFKAMPKYYIKTTKDLIVSPESQEAFLKRQEMTRVFTLESSHTPFISQPEKLAQLFAEINDLETAS